MGKVNVNFRVESERPLSVVVWSEQQQSLFNLAAHIVFLKIASDQCSLPLVVVWKSSLNAFWGWFATKIEATCAHCYVASGRFDSPVLMNCPWLTK